MYTYESDKFDQNSQNTEKGPTNLLVCVATYGNANSGSLLN